MRVRVTPGFILTVGLLPLLMEPWEAAVVLAAALAHELGHLLALKICGGRAGELVLGLGGFEIRESRLTSYPTDAVVAAAGPAVSLGLAAVSAFAARASGCRGLYVFSGANLAFGAMNLIPVSALDGGRILYAFAALAFGPDAADRAAFAVDVILITIAAAFGTRALLEYGNATLLVAAAVLMSNKVSGEAGLI